LGPALNLKYIISFLFPFLIFKISIIFILKEFFGRLFLIISTMFVVVVVVVVVDVVVVVVGVVAVVVVVVVVVFFQIYFV